MTAEVFISRVHFPVTSLGPGQRVGVWFQGCSIRCPGCVSLDTWAAGRGLVTIDALCESITPWLEHADGLTISGGEPLDQQEALEQLLVRVRSQFSGDILMFSGYPEVNVLANPIVERGLVDAVVPEPYELNESQSFALRGSDNQPLIPITELGRQRFSALEFAQPIKRVDFMQDGEHTWLAGIPSTYDINLLATVLQEKGHRVITSADKRVPSPHAATGLLKDS